MNYYFAPLEGVTGSEFRRAHHRWFPGVDAYYMPFLSPTQDHVFTPRELRNVLPEHNQGFRAVPQLLTKNPEDFLWCAGELSAMGYGEVNLNLGCPSGTVTAKGKGAGMLARPEELDWFLDTVFSQAPPMKISLKTRLGLEDPEEFPRLLEIFAKYPVSLLILHPRVRADFYKRPVRTEWFRYALDHYQGPLCFNGGLVTAGDCARFARDFPGVDQVMIGQGLLANPALVRQARGRPRTGQGDPPGLPRRAVPHLSGALRQPAEHRIPHEGAVELPVPAVCGGGRKTPQAHPQGGRLPRL